VIGYVLEKNGFPLPPMILAIVLGELIESNFRRVLTISGGSFLPLYTSPISAILIVLALVSFALPFIRRKRQLAEAQMPE